MSVDQSSHSRPLTPNVSSSSLSGMFVSRSMFSILSLSLCVCVCVCVCMCACVHVGVWAARADYLPHTLEPREMNSLWSPRRSPSEHSGNGLTLEELVARRDTADQVESTDSSTVTSVDKRELEKGIREALFRDAPATASPSATRQYKGRPLQGAWATAGQTGASVVVQRGGSASPVPVSFRISSSGSNSGSGTPQRSGSMTPDSRVDQTPPPQLPSYNWSTPPSSRRGRHGNRGRLHHSRSGPAESVSAESGQMRATPRRYHSEQYQSGANQSNHENGSRDKMNQSEANNWNIHMPRSHRHGNSSDSRRGGRGRGNSPGLRSHSRRDGEVRGQQYQAHGRRDGEVKGQQYQRSKSDWSPHNRGAPTSHHRNQPQSEPGFHHHH